MKGASTTPPTVSVRGRVEWMDTDAAGIHHHTAIARFAETAESQLMDQLGLDEYFSQAPRVRYEVSFESPLFFQQEVTEERVRSTPWPDGWFSPASSVR